MHPVTQDANKKQHLNKDIDDFAISKYNYNDTEKTQDDQKSTKLLNSLMSEAKSSVASSPD